MHPDVHRYLDGELPFEALDDRAREELRRWEQLTTGASRLAEIRAPDSMADRVMADLPDTVARVRPGWKRAASWLWQPHTVRVRPLAAVLAAAAAVILLVLGPARSLVRTPDQLTAVPGPDAGIAPVYVQFVFDSDQAASVGVAGDFNGWDPAGAPLRDPDGDGVWTAMFPLEPGVHKYMFVVDGKQWVTDPRAEAHVEDGFGMRNALITVGPVPEKSS